MGGTMTWNSTYSFNRLSTEIRPPSSSVSPLVRFSPIPVLMAWRCWVCSKIRNLLNTSAHCFSVRPRPELRTRNRMEPSGCILSQIRIYPFSGVYLNALERRLKMIFSSAFRSVVKGSVPPICTDSSILLSPAISV